MALTIRAAIDEGAAEFDMLWGAEPYKWLWARDAADARAAFTCFPPHSAGLHHRRAVEARRRLGRWPAAC